MIEKDWSESLLQSIVLLQHPSIWDYFSLQLRTLILRAFCSLKLNIINQMEVSLKSETNQSPWAAWRARYRKPKPGQPYHQIETQKRALSAWNLWNTVQYSQCPQRRIAARLKNSPPVIHVSNRLQALCFRGIALGWRAHQIFPLPWLFRQNNLACIHESGLRLKLAQRTTFWAAYSRRNLLRDSQVEREILRPAW